MKVSEAFPSKYLKAVDLNDQDIVATIKSVIMENIGQADDPQEKLVLYFTDQDKGLVCNKTNAGVIAKLYGDDTESWIGKQVTLWPNHDVEFKGEIVSAIRIRSRLPAISPLRQSSAANSTFIAAVYAAKQPALVQQMLIDFKYETLTNVPQDQQDEFLDLLRSMPV